MSLSEATTLNFELVSPEARLLSEPVTKVAIPGEEGDFGVLPNHSALVASIRPGVVLAYTEGYDEPRKIFIAGGFADVTATNCTILAEEAVNVADLNEEALKQTIRNLNEDLGMAEGEVDKARITTKLELAKAKLSAVTGSLTL